MNLKVTRDFLIPIVFLVVGRNFADIKNADRIVFFATGLILLFALFEYFFLDAYLRVFGVLDYYVAKGSLDALDPSLQWSNGLMLNGVRTAEGGGRVLLPFLLEDHRVSSLFLESISLGNFGALVAFWGIIRSRMEGRPYFWSIVAGIILIVLSDNRFNASFLPIGVVFLFASPRLTKPVVMVLPFVAILGLCLIAANAEPQEVPGLDGGSLWDRLVYSGRILLDLDGPNWLGIWPLPPYTLDAGYAYIISTVGLIGLVACWLWFTSLTGPSRYFYAFRNTIAAYFAVLLCISQSLFTIKTAALLWFLLGVLSVAKDVAPRVVPTRHRT
jgi:putative polymerase